MTVKLIIFILTFFGNNTYRQSTASSFTKVIVSVENSIIHVCGGGHDLNHIAHHKNYKLKAIHMEYLQAVTLVNMDVLEYIGASTYKAVSGIRAKAPPTRLSISHTLLC